MKLETTNRLILTCSLLLFWCAGLLLSPAAAAIEFDEVRDFDDVFVISASAESRDRVEIRWRIEDDYYLYNNKFLRFTSLTEGVVLGEPQLPRGEVSFDELLGEEVEKYHGQLTVSLPLASVDSGVDFLQLRVRSQGCLENELCYPPTEQQVQIELPGAEAPRVSGGPERAASSGLSSFSSSPNGSLFGDDNPALQPHRKASGVRQPSYRGLVVHERRRAGSSIPSFVSRLNARVRRQHCAGSFYGSAWLLPVQRQVRIPCRRRRWFQNPADILADRRHQG